MSSDDQPVPVTTLLADGRPTTKHRIAFKDCDLFGMLYNTRFLDYVLDARNEHLIDYHNVDFVKYHYEGGRTFVVAGHQVSYFEPGRAHEQVLVSTGIIFADNHQMVLEGAMTSLDGKRLKFHQWTRLKVLDPATGKAATITDAELDAIERTMTGPNIADPHDYAGRLLAILHSFKS